MPRLKRRQRIILDALKQLGGMATTRQIAELTHLHPNGVSQSLSALADKGYAKGLGGKGGDYRWALSLKYVPLNTPSSENAQIPFDT